MPLRRSKSLAGGTGKKAENGGKLSPAASNSTSGMKRNDWTSLALLTSLPRAHFTRRKPLDHHYHSHRKSLNHHNNNYYYYHPHQQLPQPPPTATSNNSSSGCSSVSFKASSREVHMKALSELQTAASRLPHPEVVYGAMIPEPDYSDDERESTNKPAVTAMVARNNQVNSSDDNKEQQKPQPGQGRMDERGLIMPKKLVNPCLESSDKKNLHRELMFNQKRGVNILNQKTELQKAMEKHNDKKVLKEQEKEKQATLTPFQKALDERAQKIEQMEKAEKNDTENEKTPSCEFEKIHAKVRAKMEVQ